MEYRETDCTFRHEGREFASGGAVVTASHIVAYPAANGELQDWHGKPLGTWRSVASWPVRSFIGDRMYQIEARVDGQTYTGRGFGEGMLYRGKAKAVRKGRR